jgi:hypothetical protein
MATRPRWFFSTHIERSSVLRSPSSAAPRSRPRATASMSCSHQRAALSNVDWRSSRRPQILSGRVERSSASASVSTPAKRQKQPRAMSDRRSTSRRACAASPVLVSCWSPTRSAPSHARSCQFASSIAAAGASRALQSRWSSIASSPLPMAPRLRRWGSAGESASLCWSPDS